MANVFDVAKYILEENGKMSTWKLQKLCYYAQAWTLAWDGRPLFDEDFEAWANGPVCPSLFQKHKGYYSVDSSILAEANSASLSPNDKENIDIVLNHYGDKEPYWLREQTHNEDPWINARAGIPDGTSCNNVITKASMNNYYGSL